MDKTGHEAPTSAAKLRISEKSTGKVIFEGAADFFYQDHQSLVIGHDHMIPEMEAIVELMRASDKQRTECRFKASLTDTASSQNISPAYRFAPNRSEM